jgi:four helix bundle protein
MTYKTPKIQNSKTPNKLQNKNSEKIYDLEKRLEKYFERVIILCKNCPVNVITKRIIPQLIASSGSISANYAEATEAMSKRDFVKCIKICRKEAKESKVWLKGLKLFGVLESLSF